ncbi:hypothetical protein Tco_0135018 [Tanacetum coccineum]
MSGGSIKISLARPRGGAELVDLNDYSLQYEVVISHAMIGFFCVAAGTRRGGFGNGGNEERHAAHVNQEKGVNITSSTLHPGSIATDLLRYHNIIDHVVVFSFSPSTYKRTHAYKLQPRAMAGQNGVAEIPRMPPKNLLLTSDGHIKIAGFGSVKPMQDNRITALPNAGVFSFVFKVFCIDSSFVKLWYASSDDLN